MFISFEGLDSSGKTTQALRVVERLRALTLPAGSHPVVHFIREPGGTSISERVREILLDKKHLEMHEIAELLLFSAARAQLVRQVVCPALEREEIVVCDRYCDSTTAYQGYGRGIDMQAIDAVNAVATGGTMPDVTFFVDIPVEEIERRKRAAGMEFDRMEQSGREFYARVRAGYAAMAAREPGRFVRVEGIGSVQSIEQAVWNELGGRLRERGFELRGGKGQ